MKSYFNFSFLGWVFSVDKTIYKTKNGISYQKIRVVNGSQFNLFFIFEDSNAFMKLRKGDLVYIQGSINKIEFESCYFKVNSCQIIQQEAAQEEHPSSDRDIHEALSLREKNNGSGKKKA